MTSVWGFLLQTLTASMVALVLFFLQQAFLGKFSPRWQYWLWGLLALRLLIPVNVARQYLFVPLSFWLETLKSVVEARLSSIYAAQYVPIPINHPFPQWTGMPHSITDWLFLLYALGVVLSLLGTWGGYLRLRGRLRHGVAVDAQTERQIRTVAERYKLKVCRAIVLPGVSSPFVCGLIRPLLVLPVDGSVEDKVLLHELLHVKYHDPLQNFAWAMLLNLHWCNPILRLTGRKIRNDMESLCDQRALEHLEGEERRDYGRILLSMVDERYPSRPGTGCISNGGRQIAERITAIARFRQYPKSLGVLVLCIAGILVQPFLLGMRNEAALMPEVYKHTSWSLHRLMAATRINRCTSLAGAVDTYAKGLMYNQGVYLAAASPLSKQGALLERMEAESAEGDFPHDYRIQGGLSGIRDEDGYAVYGLKAADDGSYRARLAFFRPTGEQDPDEILSIRLDRERGYYAIPYQGAGELIVISVKLWDEDGWVLAEEGREVIPVSEHRRITHYGDSIPSLGKTYVGESRYGSVRLTTQRLSSVQNQGAESGDWNKVSGSGVYVELFDQFDSRPKPSAQFDQVVSLLQQSYTLPSLGGDAPQRSVAVQILARSQAVMAVEPDLPTSLEDGNNRRTVGDIQVTGYKGNSQAYYSFSPNESTPLQFSWESSIFYDKMLSLGAHPIQGEREEPAQYVAGIYWDDVLQETLILKEVNSDGE